MKDESGKNSSLLEITPSVIASAWWHRAIFYEIYIRSFKDSNSDGIGDLPGITAKLDYLADLGISAIWITPFYPSPQVDFGYDISDFRNVDPRFGTLNDFDCLVREAHKRDIRIICDLVFNHTSDRHPWFLESRSSRSNPKRDWYIWANPKDGGPPNNWSSAFGPTAWSFDPQTEQYYYHFFDASQPDLNWRNPAVESAIFDIVRFWIDRNVDGFRLDSLNCFFKDVELRDNPVLTRLRPGSQTEYEQEMKYNSNLPEIHAVLGRLRALTDQYGKDRLLLGEVWVDTPDDLLRYYGPHNDELHLALNLFLAHTPRLNADIFRSQLEQSDFSFRNKWLANVLSSHDLPRAYDRYGDGVHKERIAKLLGTMLLTVRGAPVIYYGEEIGMGTAEPKSLDEVRDPLGKQYWPAKKGRDGARTPMQWDGGPNYAFSTARPWLELRAGEPMHTVAAQVRNPDSILNFYKRAIQVRQRSTSLVVGDYRTTGNNPNVLTYWRIAADESMLVALNMSPETQEVCLKGGPGGERGDFLRVLDNLTPEIHGVIADKTVLEPYQAVVLKFQSR